MGTRSRHSSHSRTRLGSRWPNIPRDYLSRRRYFRKISSVVMILLLSLILAGFIIYTSDPGGFSSAGH
jgi:hypothetical protein